MQGDNKAMCKRINLLAILLTMAVCFASLPASADNITINTSDATPFLYGDRSYVPLQNVTSFLGAQLSWDPVKARTVVSYQGKDLVLKPNRLDALFMGQSVALSSPPVVVNGRTYISTDALKKYYNVPIEWDRVKSEMNIKGQKGWGTMKVNNRPPWHGGPPPWAPAWGERRNQGMHNAQSSDNQKQHKNELKSKSKQKGKAKVK